jgi:hypothetical protein
MSSKSFLSILVAGVFIFGSALLVSNFSFAQEITRQTAEAKILPPDDQTQDQMSKLLESQNHLIEVLEKSLVKSEPDYSSMYANFAAGSTAPRGECSTDKNQWPSSLHYKQADWDVNFISGSGIQVWNDVNGDGLLDYIISTRLSSIIKSCVYLNTGSGWERRYKCVAELTNNVWNFYGDCADTAQS